MTAPPYETLDHTVRDGILTLTLDRPDQLNALTMTMAEELGRQRLRARRVAAMFYTSIGDGKEGVQAFLDKRTPEFEGRASELPPFHPWQEDQAPPQA